MTKQGLPPLTDYLIHALRVRYSTASGDWKAVLWSLPAHLQREILFWSKEYGLPCQQIITQTWQMGLLQDAGKGRKQ